jgi:hypothetical protein
MERTLGCWQAQQRLARVLGFPSPRFRLGRVPYKSYLFSNLRYVVLRTEADAALSDWESLRVGGVFDGAKFGTEFH